MVIGDVMMDAYMWGRISRESPEAPVPIVDVDRREMRLGGAANVALNLKALGVGLGLVGCIGKDHYTDRYLDLLNASGIDASGTAILPARKTTVKTRILNGNKHVVRVDEEDLGLLSEEEEDAVIAAAAKLIKTRKWDLILFEDYNKGLLTEYIISEILNFAESKGIPTSVDPKKDQFFAYQGVSLFKPNLRELNWGMNTQVRKEDLKELAKTCLSLKKKLEADNILLTLAEAGMIWIGEELLYVPAHPRRIVDVSGAGDTVISIASVGLALGLPIKDILALANLGGGLVCEMPGVVPITGERLISKAEDLLD